MALLKYFGFSLFLILSTARPQAIDSANKKVSAILAPDSSAKDWPSRSPYMKLSSEQMAQVAIYAMESRNMQAISPAVGR